MFERFFFDKKGNKLKLVSTNESDEYYKLYTTWKDYFPNSTQDFYLSRNFNILTSDILLVVNEITNQQIAFCFYGINNEELYIHQIEVSPMNRNLGIGSNILKIVEEIAFNKKIKYVILSAHIYLDCNLYKFYLKNKYYPFKKNEIKEFILLAAYDEKEYYDKYNQLLYLKKNGIHLGKKVF